MKSRCLLVAALSAASALAAAPTVPVRLGDTVEITRSHYYCWFPTVHRFPSGVIMVGMSMCPDQRHPEGNFSAYCLSRDGGRTWSPRHTMGQQANQDGAWSESPDPDGAVWQWGSYPEPVRDGDASYFFAALTKYGRDGRTVFEDRDVTLHLTEAVYMAPTSLSIYGGPTQGLLFTDTRYKTAPNLRAWGEIVRGSKGEFLSLVYFIGADDDRRYGPHRREHFRAVLARSTDEGRSWSELSTICAVPEAGRPAWMGREGANEGSLAVLSDGRLYAIFRTGAGGMIGNSWSTDGGKTWSAPASIGFDGVAPRLHRLHNGMLALVTGRPGPVVLRLNPDGKGENWTPPLTVYDGKSTHYADLAEISPGRLLIVYDNVPYGWTEIPFSDRESRNRVLGTFADIGTP